MGLILNSYRFVGIFASMYETFAALTSVNPQHNVEWWSGSASNSIWTKTDIAGTNTDAMVDAVDEGFEIVSSASTNDETQINFNNKRQYAHDNSTAIFTLKALSNTSVVSYGGLSGNILTYNGVEKSLIIADSADINFALSTADASTSSDTEGSVALDTSFHSFKIENGSANIKSYIDGVLDVTKTTNRPTTKLQPCAGVKTLTTAAKTTRVRFFECFNTDVTILSSLSERLFSLTEVMKQRVVETFSGSVLDTDRWTYTNIGNTTNGIGDSIDAGNELATNGTAGAAGTLSFNNKRQYAHDNSVYLAVVKYSATEATTLQSVGLSDVGLSSPRTSSANSALFSDVVAVGNYLLETVDGATTSSTDSGVAVDTSYHSVKIECSSANIKLTIDGVLKVTKTTNRPTVKMQPVEFINSDVVKTISTLYCESYNKGTTPLVESVYELFNESTTVAKAHFWDWMSGNAWTSRWTKTDIAGTGSLTIQDSVNGGGLITCGATTNDETQANFNNKRQYAHDSAECIFVMKATSNTSSISYGGFSGNQLAFDGVEKALAVVSSANTNISLRTADASTSSEDTATSIPIDTARHSYKIATNSASIKLYIDGVLASTKTTNRPTTKMQPVAGVKTLTTAAKTTEIGSYEAKNT